MFDDELLDTELVDSIRKAKGLTNLRWMIDYVGVSLSGGYQMFRLGTLPKNKARRKRIVKKLAALLGVEVNQLLLRLERPKKTA